MIGMIELAKLQQERDALFTYAREQLGLTHCTSPLSILCRALDNKNNEVKAQIKDLDERYRHQNELANDRYNTIVDLERELIQLQENIARASEIISKALGYCG